MRRTIDVRRGDAPRAAANGARFAAAVALGAACALAQAADAVVARTAVLRADRYIDAPALGELASGTRVDVVRAEAGWVAVRVDGRDGWMRATGLAGDGASVAALAQLETGRSASGAIVVAAGIRGIPKASKHALVVGIDGPGRRGVDDDVASGRLLAARFGVPAENTDVVRASAGGSSGEADALGAAIDRLVARVQPGDQATIYVAGDGTLVADGDRCVSAWTLSSTTWTAATLARRLAPAASVVDKLLVIVDARFALPVAGGKAAAPRCSPSDASLPLADAFAVAGVPRQNVVVVQSAPASSSSSTPSARDATGGGPLTQALVDCTMGDADAGEASSLSIARIVACANRPARGRPGPLAVASGNVAFGPIALAASSVAPPPKTERGAAARAAIADLVAQRDGRIDVALIATPSTLDIGRDAVDLALTSSRAGFVYLVLLGSDGTSFYLLFPNDLDRDNAIAAGETMKLPRPAWRVRAQGPAGRDTIVAVVAESERDVTSFATKEGPFGVALTDAAGRAQLEWLLGRSASADRDACTVAGPRRNLAAVRACSDAFGAAVVEVVEH